MGWHLLWIIPLGLILLVAALVFLVRLWATVRVGRDGSVRVRVGYGAVSFEVYPRQPKFLKKLMSGVKKDKKPAKAPEKSEKQPEKVKNKGKSKIGGVVKDVLSLVPDALRLVTIKRLRVDWRLRAGDAAKTALTYAGVASALPPIYALFKKYFDVRKSDIYVSPEFESEKGSVEAVVKAYTTLGRALRVIIKALPILQKYDII